MSLLFSTIVNELRYICVCVHISHVVLNISVNINQRCRRTQSKQCSTKATKTAVQRARNAKPVDKKKRGRPVKYHSVEERKEAAKVAAKKHLDKKIALKRKELGLSEFVWKICNPISTVVKHSEPGPKGTIKEFLAMYFYVSTVCARNRARLLFITKQSQKISV